jgi:hypothetical protein
MDIIIIMRSNIGTFVHITTTTLPHLGIVAFSVNWVRCFGLCEHILRVIRGKIRGQSPYTRSPKHLT